MKIHLPLPIRRCLLAGLTSTAGGCLCGIPAIAEPQDLIYSGSDFTWNTVADNAVFLTSDGDSASFAQGDNVSFTNKSTVTLGEDITAGSVKIESEADVIILQDNYTLETERIELAGSLDVGNTLNIDNGTTLAVVSAPAVLNSNLVLGNGGTLASGAAANLNGNTLSLHGGTGFELTSTGNGREYTLFTGVSGLKDAQGNTIVLDSTNNAIANYFDASQPGTGFWANATLAYSNGTLQLIRHNKFMYAASEITTRKTGADINYSYSESITFRILFSSDNGNAISGTSISLNNNGRVSFIGNSNAWGEAVYGHSILLSDNGHIDFSDNSGSAIRGDSYSSINLSNNANITFCCNTASYGSAIRSSIGSIIELSGNSSVTFSDNSGSAIYGDSGSIIELSNNGEVTFSHNSGSWYGCAIYGNDSTISLIGNKSVTFTGNSVTDSSGALGGAIHGSGNSSIELNSNNCVTFSGNTSYFDGGAVGGYGMISLDSNDCVIFTGNSATHQGGAIYGYDNSIILSRNNSVIFTGNSATRQGGAIYGGDSTISLQGNKSVTFSDNSGGAIYGYFNSSILLSDNGSLTFSCNSTNSNGAAIHAHGISTSTDISNITIDNNDSVTFSENEASGSSDSYGGAIFGYDECNITLSNNDTITFRKNSSSAPDRGWGGAIYGAIYCTIEMSGNDFVTFYGNTATSAGGAIYGLYRNTITLNENSNVIFCENSAAETGGAISVHGDIFIRNNGHVEFYGNAEKSDNFYQLRSIYASGSECTISLSAADQDCIIFRDSIYIANGNIVDFNAPYTDTKGRKHRQNGDIIITGATTIDDLYRAKGEENGTESEILASRTSEVYAVTNLYGGRLRVEDGAVYKGNGITAHTDSASTVRVKDAELSHVGYDLEFNAGTALEVAGASIIRGNVKLLEKSMFKLEQAATLSLYNTMEADVAMLTVNGTAMLEGNSTLNASLTLTDGATLDMDFLDTGAVTLNGNLTFSGEVYMGAHLQDILSEMRGWKESVTLFTGLTDFVLPQSLSLTGDGYLSVGDVFSNMVGNQTHYLAYEANVGCLSVVYIPETTTTTLSLLAMTVLATRRKRKITP